MNDGLVFDPRPARSDAKERPAARLATLDGAILAIVDNGKTHAGTLLKLVVEELQRDWSIAGIVSLGPPSPGYGGRLEDVATAAEWAMAAIAAVGD